MNLQNTISDLIERQQPVCMYCGKPLKRKTVTIGVHVHDVPCWGSCGCERAKEDLRQSEAVSAMQREAEWRSRVEKRYLDAGIGKLFLTAQLGREQLAAKYADSVQGGNWLYIVGGNGSMKTLMASAIAITLIDRGVDVQFTTAYRALETLKATYDQFQSKAYDRLRKSDVLVLDDLGKENPTIWATAALFDLINGRYADNLPLIVTTNLPQSKLIAYFGNSTAAQGMVSRIVERSEVMHTGDIDTRLEKAKERFKAI